MSARLLQAAAIHDLSGVGKCSLTVALPVLSACGVTVSCLPTAILSTHTGGYGGYTFRDLTEDMRPMYEHWLREGFRFDALYSGYLGSAAQIDLVEDMFTRFKDENTLVLVDPVMADNGRLYSLFDEKMARGMARLCRRADVIVPNMTEAAFILGETYREGPYTNAYLLQTCRRLCKLGAKRVVLTGAYKEESELGAAYYDGATDAFGQHIAPRVAGMYHGAGDVFASVLLGALLNRRSLGDATALAVRFTHECIERSHAQGTDTRRGLDFEHGLWKLGQELLGEETA